MAGRKGTPKCIADANMTLICCPKLNWRWYYPIHERPRRWTPSCRLPRLAKSATARFSSTKSTRPSASAIRSVASQRCKAGQVVSGTAGAVPIGFLIVQSPGREAFRSVRAQDHVLAEEKRFPIFVPHEAIDGPRHKSEVAGIYVAADPDFLP